MKSSVRSVMPGVVSGTVIGASTTGDGAFAVADPRAFTAQREHYQTGGHYGVVDWEQTAYEIRGSACHDNGFNSVADPRLISDASSGGREIKLPEPGDRLVCRIIATDGTWHRPVTTLDLASQQALFALEETFYQEATEYGLEWCCRTPFDLIGGSDVAKREWIGNIVPGAAATGMAETIGETMILADMGESFFLSPHEIWAKPGALALAIDNGQIAFRIDGEFTSTPCYFVTMRDRRAPANRASRPRASTRLCSTSSVTEATSSM